MSWSNVPAFTQCNQPKQKQIRLKAMAAIKGHNQPCWHEWSQHHLKISVSIRMETFSIHGCKTTTYFWMATGFRALYSSTVLLESCNAISIAIDHQCTLVAWMVVLMHITQSDQMKLNAFKTLVNTLKSWVNAPLCLYLWSCSSGTCADLCLAGHGIQ